MKNPVYLFSLSSHPNATSINSLDVTFFKPSIDFSLYDYIIITSKQSVKALQEYKSQEYLSKKALAVSKNSAEAYQNAGGTILESGDGYGTSVGEIIKTYPKSTKWLYLRAKVVASSFAQECKDEGYLIDEAVVYQTQCSKEILEVEVESNATLIFTSPSSVACFLKTHSISLENRVIAIGTTTAKAFPTDINYTLSKETTIESCMDLLL